MSFLKTSQVQINSKRNEKNRMIINNINVKKFAWRKCRKIFLDAIFLIQENFFSKFPLKIFVIILRDIIGVEKFLFSVSQS